MAAAAMARRSAAGLLRPRRLYSFPYIPPRHDDESSCYQIPSPPPPPLPRAAGVERHLLLPNASRHLLFPLSSLHFSLRHYSSAGAENVPCSSSGDVAMVLDGGSVTDMAAEAAAVGPPVPFPGEVAAAAADSLPPVAAVQMLIDSVHSFTGLNWWACIVLTTVLIRLALVPLMIYTMKATIKIAKIKPELEVLQRDMADAKEAKKNGDLEPEKKCEAKLKKLYADHELSPWKMLSPLGGVIQMPIFMSFFFGVSKMAETVPSFKSGGTLWFTDLAAPDAFYILPILSTLLLLLTIELNAQEGMEGNPLMINMKNVFRGAAVISLPITITFPEACLCYWVTSSAFSLIYGLAMKRPEIRRFFDIPDLPATQTQTTQPSPPRASSPAAPSLPFKTSKISDSPLKMVTSPSFESLPKNLERGDVKARRYKPKRSKKAKNS